MLTDTGLHALMAWCSPSYPVGGFTYSHGLEAAVEAGDVRTADDLVAYVAAIIEAGGGWIDAVLFAAAYRAADDPDVLAEVNELAVAMRGSSETMLESTQQGRSFLSVTRAAWPHPALDDFANSLGKQPVAHAVAMAVSAAAHGIPLGAALAAWLHSTAANLVSAGVRLVPLGQTDGQRATARLSRLIEQVVPRALAADPDDIGTAAPLLELASLAHETQYARLFRS